jgi:hypothetical protein
MDQNPKNNNHKKIDRNLIISTERYDDFAGRLSISNSPPIQYYENIKNPVPSSSESRKSSISDCMKKRKSFMEIMGYNKNYEKASSPTVFDMEIKTPTISLTDLMGNNKYAFLKKAGFLPIYQDTDKKNQKKKIANNKHALSKPNIIHLDIIREFALKNTITESPRNSNLSPLFEKPKYCKQKKNARIDTIQTILNKCDQLYSKSRLSTKSPQLPLKKLAETRNNRKKLTQTEIKNIKAEIKRID